jgi:ribosomal protein S18 acetylase RimI-like enzyme
MNLPEIPSSILTAIPKDIPAVLSLAMAAGLFSLDDVGNLQEILDGFYAGTEGAGHQLELCLEEPSDSSPRAPIGVVYFGPDALIEQKWDLWMIAVSPNRQGQGIGSHLLRFTEKSILERGGGLLHIETSSLPKYDGTRMFYAKYGYLEVARVPDYYGIGDHKVVYAKQID